MSSKVLKKKIKRLERIALEKAREQVLANCNCRTGQSTVWHTAADLEAIMSITCPVHGFRYLRSFWQISPSDPLDPEHRHLCSCPPNIHRDRLEGKRGPITP